MEWKDEDVEYLKELIKQNKSTPEIAVALNRKISAIRMKCSRLGISLIDEGPSAPIKLKRNKKENNIATRLAILQGLILSEDIKKDIFFSDEQLKGWINHPEIFSKELLGIELQSFQQDIFNLFAASKRTAIAGGRGVSKSFSASIWLIYSSIIRPNQRSLIVSPSDRQSKLIFEQIQRFIAGNDELFNSVNLKRSNAEKISFENESEIIPLPCSAFIRGYQNVSLVLMDECAFFPDDEMIFSAVMPMLNLRNEKTNEYGSLILLSSPNGTNNKFFEFFHNPNFKTMKIPSQLNKYLDQDKLEEDKLLMSPVIYEGEYLCEFSENISNFFSIELIQKCTAEYDLANSGTNNSFTSYYLGWDTASSGKDSSVLTIIEANSRDGKLKVMKIVELQKQNLVQQMKTFEMLNEAFNFRKVCVEKAGFGEAIIDLLKEKQIPVLIAMPTIDEKATIYSHLLKKMEKGELKIPNHPKLQSQLRMFRYELSKTGKLMLHHATEQAGDDFPDSLAFATWAGRMSASSPIEIYGANPF